MRALDSALHVRKAELRREQESFQRLRSKIQGTVIAEKITLQLMNANVRFCTSIKTLTFKPGTFFAAKFGNPDRWKGDQDADGSVFIERDDLAFRHTLNYLRGYPASTRLSAAERVTAAADIDYYLLQNYQLRGVSHTTISQMATSACHQSAMLAHIPRDCVATISSWLPKCSSRLLYSASRDGWTKEAFHRLCDGAQRSFMICKFDAGGVVGGQATASWVRPKHGSVWFIQTRFR